MQDQRVKSKRTGLIFKQKLWTTSIIKKSSRQLKSLKFLVPSFLMVSNLHFCSTHFRLFSSRSNSLYFSSKRLFHFRQQTFFKDFFRYKFNDPRIPVSNPLISASPRNLPMAEYPGLEILCKSSNIWWP